MNNEIKIFPENVHDAMRNSLCLIAKEIQRFRAEDAVEKHTRSKKYEQLDLYKKKNMCLSKIKIKNRKIKILKQHLKTACGVSRIILSSKDKEIKRLTQHLNSIRNESSNLSKDKIRNFNVIQQLQKENLNINTKVLLLSDFIQLGYERLQQIRNASPEDISVIMKLKIILDACGEYYSHFCNAQHRCEQLEQRSNFLNNKINILEHNLAVSAEEIRNLKIQNLRFRSRCNLKYINEEAVHKNLKSPNKSRISLEQICNDEIVVSQYVLTPKTKKCKKEPKNTYLTSHLEAIQRLISDQNLMLKELEELYEEVHTPE